MVIFKVIQVLNVLIMIFGCCQSFWMEVLWVWLSFCVVCLLERDFIFVVYLFVDLFFCVVCFFVFSFFDGGLWEMLVQVLSCLGFIYVGFLVLGILKFEYCLQVLRIQVFQVFFQLLVCVLKVIVQVFGFLGLLDGMVDDVMMLDVFLVFKLFCVGFLCCILVYLEELQLLFQCLLLWLQVFLLGVVVIVLWFCDGLVVFVFSVGGCFCGILVGCVWVQ